MVVTNQVTSLALHCWSMPSGCQRYRPVLIASNFYPKTSLSGRSFLSRSLAVRDSRNLSERREDVSQHTSIHLLEDMLHLTMKSSFWTKEKSDIVTIAVLGGSLLLLASLLEPGSAYAAGEHGMSGPYPNAAIGELAENSDFWANVVRYVSYFFSVLLGTVYVALRPLASLLKRPTTAVLVLAGFAALYFFVSTTVSAMLGLNDMVEYSPSSIVTGEGR